MRKHALLSASSSAQWLNCPPSARLCEQYEDKGSSYATEGTDAHTLAEHKLRIALGLPTTDPVAELTYYSTEMEEHAAGYVAYILGVVEMAKRTCADPVVLVEQRLDYSNYAEEGFGTGDCVVIADGTLHVIDFKYGQGVAVSAENNSQMKLYALGALGMFDGIYDIGVVEMTVYQPRRDNISTHTVAKESLYQWGEDPLRPSAVLAYRGEGAYHSGEWCRFCKARHNCRTRAEASLELAKHDFKMSPLLTDEEIVGILGRVDALISWASDIKEHAYQAALGGKQWSGWKLVEGRSNRRYISEGVVAETLTAAGYEMVDIYKMEIRGIGEMEKLLGKKKFKDLLDRHILKPSGKPVLVPEDDKRPAVQNDFKEEDANG